MCCAVKEACVFGLDGNGIKRSDSVSKAFAKQLLNRMGVLLNVAQNVCIDFNTPVFLQNFMP